MGTLSSAGTLQRNIEQRGGIAGHTEQKGALHGTLSNVGVLQMHTEQRGGTAGHTVQRGVLQGHCWGTLSRAGALQVMQMWQCSSGAPKQGHTITSYDRKNV